MNPWPYHKNWVTKTWWIRFRRRYASDLRRQ